MPTFRLQASSKLLAISLLALTSIFPVRADDPSADEILRLARLSPRSQEADLGARLRDESGQTPLRITIHGGVVSYRFDNPTQAIVLALDDGRSAIGEEIGGKVRPIPPGDLDRRVRGTDFTYEDLALRFLYWPGPKLLGQDIVRTRGAWKLEIQSPRETGQYGVARLWVDRESGALLRVEGYDRGGNLVKRFEVNSVQRVGDQWFLKQMRVESFDPVTRKVVGRTYLEVDGPDQAPK